MMSLVIILVMTTLLLWGACYGAGALCYWLMGPTACQRHAITVRVGHTPGRPARRGV